MSGVYRPPYSNTPAILKSIGEIGESIGRYSATAEKALSPRLRRSNLVRSVQASLAIENNSLTLEQVTAVLDGKRVLGPPREILEVRNAFSAYERMGQWKSTLQSDLLEAHGVLMAGLMEKPGSFRGGRPDAGTRTFASAHVPEKLPGTRLGRRVHRADPARFAAQPHPEVPVDGKGARNAEEQ